MLSGPPIEAANTDRVAITCAQLSGSGGKAVIEELSVGPQGASAGVDAENNINLQHQLPRRNAE